MKYRGRPPKYESPEEMQKDITKYFNECDKEGKKPTMSGLAYWLGMSRTTLLRYEEACKDKNLCTFEYNVRAEFSSTIKDAKRFIESCLDDKLINGTSTPIGVIFALKNNYGWVDKQEVVQTNKEIKVELED